MSKFIHVNSVWDTIQCTLLVVFILQFREIDMSSIKNDFVHSIAFIPRRDSLVVSVFASHAAGRGFQARPGHTTIEIVQTASLVGTHVLG